MSVLQHPSLGCIAQRTATKKKPVRCRLSASGGGYPRSVYPKASEIVHYQVQVLVMSRPDAASPPFSSRARCALLNHANEGSPPPLEGVREAKCLQDTFHHLNSFHGLDAQGQPNTLDGKIEPIPAGTSTKQSIWCISSIPQLPSAFTPSLVYLPAQRVF